jgi:2-amino-4-hydroxy-6-hydroxymethyldihydropteridine diphosphokinase
LAIVYLGLGSNLGDRSKNINDAVTMLEANGIRSIKLSTIIETDPVGGPPQGLFLNAALKAETDHSPLRVLEISQNIEKQLGRIRTIKDGPRTIDIDILIYEGVKMDTPELTIPHPRMHQRDFVIKPLREIAPELATSSSQGS